uniref:DDB1- and CUL4-associated factor 1 n=1 Tax=Tetraodon nigroviridis TaxID=99883 RepID=H3CH15_TETNG
ALAVATAGGARADLGALLDEWELTQRDSTEQLVSILTRMSELIERETDEYHKSDPDPFDDRHPGRADPECVLGQLLKMLFINQDLTNALLDSYIMSSREQSLNTAACRLLHNLMPGVETAAIFQEKEGLVDRLMEWAADAARPLNVYATGLLARAMSNQEVAASYRDQNGRLVPIMIQRLHQLQAAQSKNQEEEQEGPEVCSQRPCLPSGMSILLGLAEGHAFANDAEIQKSALQVIINCVCAPDQGLLPGGPLAVAPLGASLQPAAPRVLARVWQLVQNNNGIKVLLALLAAKVPVTDADLIRALACRALVGLSRSGAVRQIVSRLPLFTSSHIQQLMKEPVLPDKRGEHARFCRYAAQLVERVSGKPLLGGEASLAHLQRAKVVARTRITFSEKELLQLIRSHLLAKGLHDTAAALAEEAGLSPAGLGPSPSPGTPRLAAGIGARGAGHGSTSPLSSAPPPRLPAAWPAPAAPPPSPPGPHPQTSRPLGRILFARERPVAHGNAGRRLCGLRQKSEHGAFIQTPAMRKQLERLHPSPPTLDSIITEYLREQHARCPAPVTTCPPFSLYLPHRCPEPRQRRQAWPNFTARLASPLLHAKRGGVHRASLDRHLIFSRFRPLTLFPEADGDQTGFTSCAFSAHQPVLMLGTSLGRLGLFKLSSGDKMADYSCHGSAITHLEPSRDGKLLLTSASWGVPLSALWNLDGVFSRKISFADEHHMEFSRLSQDRAVGTKDEEAHIYDLQTGQKLLTLSEPALANNYTNNRATFHPSDQLVLNDGVLWDVRASGAVHKFDKFNMNISGGFHPNGLEVLINTEIWDLRTFHLLHTVPALDQCRLVFNSNATVIYAAVLQADDEADVLDQRVKSAFGSSFRTFDASDYKPIATVNVKRNIFDLSADSRDRYLAVIEDRDTMSMDTVCRLYEVGRQKLAEEGDEDEDEDQDHEDSSDTDEDDEDTDMDVDALIQELANPDGASN